MLAFDIPSIEPARMNVMIYRILDEEKKNIKTKSKNNDQLIEKIETIITEEAKKLR